MRKPVLAFALVLAWAAPIAAEPGPIETIRENWRVTLLAAKAVDSAVCDSTFDAIKEKGWFYNRYENGLFDGLAVVQRENVCLAGHFTVGFTKGAAKELWGTVQIVLHPIRTVKGIASAVRHPVQTLKMVGKSLVAWKDEFVHAVREDPRKATQMTGEVTGRVAASVAISKGVDKALKAGKFQYLQWQADRNTLVTRWRGTDYVDEMVSLGEEGVLKSKADWVGYEGNWVDRTVVGQVRHSLDSAKPYSQWVSITRKPEVAGFFGKVFEFQIKKKDLYKAWWNKFHEAEDLVKSGTPIYNLHPLEAAAGAR